MARDWGDVGAEAGATGALDQERIDALGTRTRAEARAQRLVADTERLGLYDVSPDETREALKTARKNSAG
ncbi:hypothetical protein [Parafrankia sp. EUN1f]|uniref:hypothetical protein n=1 Tax=Parafrankia sp. EUN1f TaxID=102897 RepID=UPI0001C4514C|nr:hypothetical protein [Parafrankia sp. EUN1f]EFC84643.1 hypothetical protein FrEUN1fDRAFT_2198 [Parafrankia sp. EUN1f]